MAPYRRAMGRRARKPSEKGPASDPNQACIVIVFDADNEDWRHQTNEKSCTLSIRQPLVDKLRAADLIVQEEWSHHADQEEGRVYVKVSASPKRLLQVADIMGRKGLLKLRLRSQDPQERNEGPWCAFKQHLQSEFEESSEKSSSLFSSLQQIRILEFILEDRDKMAMGPQLVHPKTLQAGYTPLEWLKKEQMIRGFFRMHNEPTRKKLHKIWVQRWTDKQPIEQIREYFGEKIALYFVFLGYYTTMLWIPALCGLALFMTQLYSRYKTGSMDNPWVPLYCCFITVWAIAFSAGWKRLEKGLQHEWDTLTYEEEEEDRREFILNKQHTDITFKEVGESRRTVYSCNPTHRRNALMLSAFVVFCFISAVVAVVFAVALFKFRLIQFLEPWGLSAIGKGVGASMQACSILAFNKVYQIVLTWLTDHENWQKATEVAPFQYEDATIAKDFCFKLVNAYFACFFVAFVQNNFKVYGVDLHCPEWHCMQELTATLAGVFLIQMTVAQLAEVGGVWVKIQMKNKTQSDITTALQSPLAMEEPADVEEGKGKGGASAVELQDTQLMEYPSSGVFEEYQEMVVQYGYVTLFAAAFPLTSMLALVNNIIEIRTDAFKLLQLQQRPPYKCAADIGTWQVILDILTTCSILTNCALVGFTSHGLFFYFPRMLPVQRVWITLICEHVLLLLKLLVDTFMDDEPKEMMDKFKKRQAALDAVMQTDKFKAPDEDQVPFFTDDEGDPFMGR